MKTIRLLYLSSHQMTAYRWHSGELSNEGQFPATEAGHGQFADYLHRQKNTIYTLLANVAEEGFHTETIPFLRGADRKTMIERKLGQLFFNSPLTASQSLGYERSKRKNERIMLAALTNSTFFAPWLNTITSARAALSGIYSLPLLGASLLKKLNLSGTHCLLLTVQDQSIRQNYLEKGELHFSRLTPLHNSSIGGIAQAFASEAIKLQQYLTSQRQIGRNQPITAHILAHPGALKAIQTSCISTATIHFDILNIEDCARKTGLKTPLPDTHCEQLFLNLLVAAPPRIQFANDVQRHDYHLAQFRSGFYGLGALALLGSLLVSGKFLYEAHSVRQETQILQDESTLSRRRYDEIVKTFPAIPTDSETLRRIIDRYLELEKKGTSPHGLYRELSRALDAVPEAELEKIDWKASSQESGTVIPGQTPMATDVPKDSEALVVHGTLNQGSNAKPRQILGAFDTFVDVLKTNSNLQIEILKRPFDIESGKSLIGGDTALEDGKPRTFSLQIMRKIGS